MQPNGLLGVAPIGAEVTVVIDAIVGLGRTRRSLAHTETWQHEDHEFACQQPWRSSSRRRGRENDGFDDGVVAEQQQNRRSQLAAQTQLAARIQLAAQVRRCAVLALRQPVRSDVMEATTSRRQLADR